MTVEMSGNQSKQDKECVEPDARGGYSQVALLRVHRQAGRRLAESLGDRRYAEEEPRRFFTRCYDLRSKLVPGYHPRPERGEVDALAATLESFVSDLLAGALRDESPR
jgi:hypothetical protein